MTRPRTGRHARKLGANPVVNRRRFLAHTLPGIVVAAGGCTGITDRGAREQPTGPPSTVTLTSGARIEVSQARIVVRDGSDGPRAGYRLRNAGPTAATIEVTTVLHIDGGGSYEAAAVVDVDAGGEVVLEYPVVGWERLAEAERANVAQGGYDFDVYVNGEPIVVA